MFSIGSRDHSELLSPCSVILGEATGHSVALAWPSTCLLFKFPGKWRRTAGVKGVALGFPHESRAPPRTYPNSSRRKRCYP